MLFENSYSADLGSGYSVSYEKRKNSFGRYRIANMTLFRSVCNGKVSVPVRRLVSRSGWILHFPGVVHGNWEKLLTSRFRPRVNFMASVGDFQNGLACFSWTVQPDGWYFADGDGFGADSDVEVRLYAVIDTSGRFVTPFSNTKPDLPQKTFW